MEKWQKLKLKRLRLKSDIPDKNNLQVITNIWFSKQQHTIFRDDDDRIYLNNIHNHKWYELFNEIIEK